MEKFSYLQEMGGGEKKKIPPPEKKISAPLNKNYRAFNKNNKG